ncbi:MBL fold metallo-hydrolase [Salinisphaera hydrothermalis]|uniref:Beta-lactamase domain-containing protein n=1 Tax=Salinisphaera hydrothermalis (strain C41B8) TaxID=1304275 RepID=A0A084IP17_SALHC|nr:MBL fold metallo-hydrolase [Salinisphaera hydrothermalis]KEZ78451.1 beta-lactamase domain-containing protein [Salinisphaera hydrothermalis C41B8]
MAAVTSEVTGFYDDKTGSVQYVVVDPSTARCAIIDPVWNYDETAARTSTESFDAITAFIDARGLTVEWILDTHPHADHFSAGVLLGERYGAPRAIGEKVVEVQKLWKRIYNFGDDYPTDGRQWDRLFADGETFQLGNLDAHVMLSPGHTLASITYVIGDAAFVHDTLFMPDSGTARADFPGGDARTLFRSIQRILELPDATRIFVGHDYRPDGREARWESTVAEQRATNTHLRDDPSEDEYVAMRESRDATLPLPALMLAALQVNTRGGRLPEPEDNGRSYLKIPLNQF